MPKFLGAAKRSTVGQTVGYSEILVLLLLNQHNISLFGGLVGLVIFWNTATNTTTATLKIEPISTR